jgi:hypothetical protein
MKFMKKMASIMVSMLLLAATSSAFANSIPVNVIGVQGPVGSFDWKPGNALAVNAISNNSLGNPFQLYYQASLSSYLDPNGNVITNNNGLKVNNDITVIASFGEIVKNLTVISPTEQSATFGLDPNMSINYVKMYYNNNPATFSSDLNGTNFDAGALILSGHVTNLLGSTFATTGLGGALDASPNGNQWGATQTLQGSGGSFVVAAIDWYDPNYITATHNLVLKLADIDTSNNLPFTKGDPAKFMNNGAGGLFATNVGAVNALTGPDVLFASDGVTSFSAVPEPSTMMLLGFGLAGLVGLRYRKAKK